MPDVVSGLLYLHSNVIADGASDRVMNAQRKLVRSTCPRVRMIDDAEPLYASTGTLTWARVYDWWNCCHHRANRKSPEAGFGDEIGSARRNCATACGAHHTRRERSCAAGPNSDVYPLVEVYLLCRDRL
jgi:hypothetical protein